MDFIAKQILAPKSWTDFEDLCRSLFSAVWGDPYAQKHGRIGQPQHGVDVWGDARGRHPGIHCVQCKGKDVSYHGKVTRAEFKRELANATQFQPTPAYWILATTAPNDETLQRYARLLSRERQARGEFPVAILGWETLVGLMAEHPKVIESFYPGQSARLDELLEGLRRLPGRAEWLTIIDEVRALRSNDTISDASTRWLPVSFDGDRGLGPALLGRALGAVDAKVCPRLPEASALVTDLRESYSARLTGLPGAGKSVCALQAAETLVQQGFRILRLADARTIPILLTQDEVPTLHLIDDAHLAMPQILAAAEQTACPTKLLLTTHTAIDERTAPPGTIHLDAKRAVRVIAQDLRAHRRETLEAVRRVDDRVGDAPGDESLELRLEHAERAEIPWQFCFVLSGGWRRVTTIASSARASNADIALATISIRQLASRDARANADDLAPLFAVAGLSAAEADRAVAWLTAQRIVNSPTDLRCPHQRFSAAVLDPILEGQDAEGRRHIASVMANVLADTTLPLAGLRVLLTEWRMAGQGGRWTRLCTPEALEPFIERCWEAKEPQDVMAACYVLREIDSYLPDWMQSLSRTQVLILAGWFSAPVPGVGYAIGSFINGTYRHRPLGRAIARASVPEAIAAKLNEAAPAFACEIAEMVTSASGGGALTRQWRTRYLAQIDRGTCLKLVAEWPRDESLYAVADYCAHFVQLDEQFGLDLIEALIPAIAGRMLDDPISAFRQLDDIFWHCLRVYDPLGVYTGKNAPSPRMRELSAKLCSVWKPGALALKLSHTTLRQFQDAAGLLSVLRKSLPEAYGETIAALDWNAIDATIGPMWARLPHDVEIFLAMCHGSKEGRRAVAELIGRRIDRMAKISTRMALLAPDVARTFVRGGGSVSIAHFGHVDWQLGSAILADFHENSPALMSELISPHEEAIAKALSQISPTWFNESLMFLRVYRHVALQSFEAMLGQIDVVGAERGWSSALQGLNNNRVRGSRKAAREAIAWLIYCSRNRTDATGKLARTLAERFPEQSAPAAATLMPIEE